MSSTLSSRGKASVTSRRHRKRVVGHLIQNSDKENNKANSNHSVIDDVSELNLDLKGLSLTDDEAFLLAIRTCSAVDFWKRQSTSYIHSLLNCSRSLSYAPLQLIESEDHLIDATRRSIKSVIDQKNRPDCLIQELIISTHVLRALSTITNLESNKQIVVLKLIYHALVTLSDRLSNLPSEGTVMLLPITLGLYEAMSRSLKYIKLIETSPSNSLFNIRITAQKAEGTNIRQIFKMIIQSTLATGSMLSYKGKSSMSLEFGSNIANIIQTIDVTTALPSLVLHVCLPWTRKYANSDSENSDKEILAFAKASHRLLWDAATAETNPSIALILRRQAIQALVLNADAHLDSVTLHLISTSCSTLASTYAWKAACTFVQQTNSQGPQIPSCLKEFHETLGPVLSIVSQPQCLSYTEYRAYRLIHTGILNPDQCLKTRSLSNRDASSNTANSLGEATYSLISIVVSFLGHLVPESTSDFALENLKHYDSITALKNITRKVIDVYQRALDETHSFDVIKRCHKMIQGLGLHHRFAKLRKLLSEMGTVEFSATYITLIDICESIISQCVLPILRVLLNKETDAKALVEYWDSYVDTNLRICTLLDAFHSMTGDSLLSDKVDQLVVEFHSTLDVSKPSFTLLECWGKNIYAIGKRRNDSNHPAIVPLAYSLNILTQMESICQTKDFIKSNQMISRYSYMASVFSNLSMHGTAGLALIAALAYDCVDEIPVTHDISATTLSNVLDLSLGMQLSKKSTISIIYRLLEILNLDVKVASAVTDISIIQLSERMIHAAAKKGDCNELNLSGSLYGTFRDINSRVNNHRSDAWMSHLSCVVAYSLISFGKDLMENVGQEKAQLSYDLQMKQQALILLLYRLLTSVVPGYSHDTLLAFAYHIAVSSFTHNNCSQPMRQFYWQQLEKATKHLGNVQANGSEGLLLSYLRLDNLYRHYSFEAMSTKHAPASLINYCEEVVASLLKMDLSSIDMIQSKVFKCMQLLIFNLHSHFCLNGEYVKAAKTAYWNSMICKKLDTAHSFGMQLPTGILTNKNSDDMIVVASNLSGFVGAASKYRNPWTHICAIQLKIEKIRIEGTVCRVDNINQCMMNLQSVSDELQTTKECIGSDFLLQHICSWVETTILVAKGEMLMRQGRAYDAVDSLKACIKASQRGRRRVGQGAIFDIDHSHWRLPLDNLFSMRKIECLVLLALSYDSIGDYRKSEAYLITASGQAGLPMTSGSRIDLSALGTASKMIKTPQQAYCFRRLVSLKCQMHSRLESQKELWESIAWSNSEIAIVDDDQLETRLEQISALQCSSGLDHNLTKSLFLASKALNNNFSTELLSSFGAQVKEAEVSNIFQNMLARLKLLESKAILSQKGIKAENLKAVTAMCTDMIYEKDIMPTLAATAYYYLGLVHLVSLRNKNGLVEIWENQCCTQGDDLQKARDAFELGILLSDSTSIPLRRDLFRSLALVLGPIEKSKRLRLGADRLLFLSIGATSQSRFTNESQMFVNENEDKKMEQSTDVYDEKLLDLATQVLPRSWNIIGLAFCPTGELLISGLQDGVRECACIFPSNRNVDEVFDPSIYNAMMAPLDSIVVNNDNELNRMHDPNYNGQSFDEASKREWWQNRITLDDEIRHLLDRTNREYFCNRAVERILQKETLAYKRKDDSPRSSRGNLASKFEAALHSPPRILDQASLKKMTVAQLKVKLDARGISYSNRLKKADLIELLLLEEEIPAKDINEANDDDESRCVILILDENLHRFPLEGLSCLENQSVTRMPSLRFLLSSFTRRSSIEVDPRNARYVIDPESNLKKTAERMMPFIETLNSQAEWEWKGVVGESPTEEFLIKGLTQDNGLFLYCGHGGGNAYFSKKKIDELIERSANPMPCNSTIILMGCSSGKLASINRKFSSPSEHVTLFYEPEGIALSYLMAGSPCVVANLWDVTDRDIDRFCLTFMEQFLGEDRTSIASCVRNARSICRMKHIVGLAPVCYGLPVVRK